jgi:hypothetical protein
MVNTLFKLTGKRYGSLALTSLRRAVMNVVVFGAT